jgi:hypothetical protein
LLSETEKQELMEGKVLIRNIDKYKNMCIEGSNPGIVKLREIVKEQAPNYLAEVIQIKPYEGNENLQEVIRSALENISDYAGIPYWSERHQRYWDLYSSAAVVGSFQVNETTKQINADLYMEPFGLIHSPILIEQTDDYLLYNTTNNNNLKFEGFTVVKKQNMKSVILLFRHEDKWILYGVGGVKALKVSFLEKRIETSFINRIKTFCNFVFTKI